MVLHTGNPIGSSLEKIPFDSFVKNGCIHQSLWNYWLTKGPTALPSAAKCVQKGVSWAQSLLKEEYQKLSKK